MRYARNILVLSIFSVTIAGAQIPITLLNASFESATLSGGDEHGVSHQVVPSWEDWTRVSFPQETPPKVYVIVPGARHYHQTAQDGKTYLGLAVHKDDTWQSIGQELREPLSGGKRYSLSLYACLDPDYAKNNPGSRDIKAKPVVIRILGAKAPGEKGEVLATSEAVRTEDWTWYSIDFQPETNYRCLIIEAYYVPGTGVRYDGHLLIDNAQLLRRF